MTHKFKRGDTVFWLNENGIRFGELMKKIDDRPGQADIWSIFLFIDPEDRHLFPPGVGADGMGRFGDVVIVKMDEIYFIIPEGYYDD